MRCLLLYYSLTGQAERAVTSAATTIEAAGHTATLCRIDLADPAQRPVRPFSIKETKKWVEGSQKGMVLKLDYMPRSAITPDHDLVLIFSNTWGKFPSVPIRSFLESPEAPIVLAGKPFGVYLICRRLWENNLAVTRRLAEAAGGHFRAADAFTHPGGNIGSLVQTVTYMLLQGPPRKRFLGFKLPHFGLSADSMARIPTFTDALLAAAKS